MLVWGGDLAGEGLSDGAAYDPVADTWRSIKASPLPWTINATSVWTGSEWVVARTGLQEDLEVLQFMAYDPVADSWRQLPSLESTLGSGTSLIWTGEELVELNFSSAGLQRLEPGAVEWAPIEPMRLNGNLIWTGTRAMGLMLEYLGTDDPRYRATLAEWDPGSDTWVLVPDPLGNLNDDQTVWADGRVLLLRSDLVYDVSSQEWWALDFPETERLGAVQVWMGDRLAIWGGGEGDPSEVFTEGLVITPTW